MFYLRIITACSSFSPQIHVLVSPHLIFIRCAPLVDQVYPLTKCCDFRLQTLDTLSAGLRHFECVWLATLWTCVIIDNTVTLGHGMILSVQKKIQKVNYTEIVTERNQESNTYLYKTKAKSKTKLDTSSFYNYHMNRQSSQSRKTMTSQM